MGKVSRRPTLYLIAGCNGAGKTTFAKIFLPSEVKCLRFLNADEIARGLSPLAPAQSAIKAGRILLEEISACLQRKETFALESTLSGKTYIKLFRRALELGYEIELHYLWLATPKQAIARVRRRVCKGGHDVPSDDIKRRFFRKSRASAGGLSATRHPLGDLEQHSNSVAATRIIYLDRY